MSANVTQPQLQNPVVISPEGKTLEVSQAFFAALEDFMTHQLSGSICIDFRSGRMMKVEGVKVYR